MQWNSRKTRRRKREHVTLYFVSELSVCAKYDTTIMQDYDYLCTKTDGPTAII